MEEIYEYVQMISRFPKKPLDIIEEKELIDEKGSDAQKFSRTVQHIQIRNSVLSLPTDYSYIKPYKYKEMNDICYQVSQTPANEKWLKMKL